MEHEFIIPEYDCVYGETDWANDVFNSRVSNTDVEVKCPYCGDSIDKRNFLNGDGWVLYPNCNCFKGKWPAFRFKLANGSRNACYELTYVDEDTPETLKKTKAVFDYNKCKVRPLKEARFTRKGTVILPVTDEDVARGLKPDYSVELSFPDDVAHTLREHIRKTAAPRRDYRIELYSSPSSKSSSLSDSDAQPQPELKPEDQKQSTGELEQTQSQLVSTLGAVLQKKQAEEKQLQKGGAVMSNQFDFTMHPLEDPNVASTVLGIAVKVGDSWRVYDKAKEEITDLGNAQFGNFPIWVIPAFKLAPGDIIIDGGKYYCVTSKNKRLQTVDIGTGKSHSVVPIKNILGFSVYQKVMALTDVIGLDDVGTADDKMLLLLAMMGGAAGGDADGNAMNQMSGLLPLLLLKDMGSESKGGDSKLLLLAMMGGMNGMGDQNGLMQLLMMKQLMGDGLLGSDAAPAE